MAKPRVETARPFRSIYAKVNGYKYHLSSPFGKLIVL